MSRDDALVDVYRDIMAIKRNLAADSAPSVTPGAGRGCRLNRHAPGKRLRNWHRADRRGLSLRSFARAVASGRLEMFQRDAKATAQRWLASKGARP